jgi:hypothetical protein
MKGFDERGKLRAASVIDRRYREGKKARLFHCWLCLEGLLSPA